MPDLATTIANGSSRLAAALSFPSHLTIRSHGPRDLCDGPGEKSNLGTWEGSIGVRRWAREKQEVEAGRRLELGGVRFARGECQNVKLALMTSRQPLLNKERRISTTTENTLENCRIVIQTIRYKCRHSNELFTARIDDLRLSLLC